MGDVLKFPMSRRDELAIAEMLRLDQFPLGDKLRNPQDSVGGIGRGDFTVIVCYSDLHKETP